MPKRGRARSPRCPGPPAPATGGKPGRKRAKERQEVVRNWSDGPETCQGRARPLGARDRVSSPADCGGSGLDGALLSPRAAGRVVFRKSNRRAVCELAGESGASASPGGASRPEPYGHLARVVVEKVNG